MDVLEIPPVARLELLCCALLEVVSFFKREI